MNSKKVLEIISNPDYSAVYMEIGGHFEPMISKQFLIGLLEAAPERTIDAYLDEDGLVILRL